MMFSLSGFHCLLLTCLLCYVTAGVVDDPFATQYGALYCTLDGDIMTATLYLFKNSSKTTDAFFFNSANKRYTTTGCRWSSGIRNNKAFFESVVYINVTTDNAPSGRDFCGHTIESAEDNMYSWTVHASSYNERFYVGGDKDFQFTCSPLPNTVSVTHFVDLRNVEVNAIEIRPVNRMKVLKRGTNLQYTETDNIGVGDSIRLRVESLSPTPRRVNIDHYGVFVFSCDYRWDFNGPRITLNDGNGCGRKFTFIEFATIGSERWFHTQTDSFTMSTTISNTNNNIIYFTCYVGYCYGNEVEPKCQDYCDYRTRRKRSNQDKIDIVEFEVKITPEGQAEENAALKDTIVIIACSVVGVVVLVTMVICVILCKRRSRRQTKDSASTTSSRQNIYPEYPSKPYKY